MNAQPKIRVPTTPIQSTRTVIENKFYGITRKLSSELSNANLKLSRLAVIEKELEDLRANYRTLQQLELKQTDNHSISAIEPCKSDINTTLQEGVANKIVNDTNYSEVISTEPNMEDNCNFWQDTEHFDDSNEFFNISENLHQTIIETQPTEMCIEPTILVAESEQKDSVIIEHAEDVILGEITSIRQRFAELEQENESLGDQLRTKQEENNFVAEKLGEVEIMRDRMIDEVKILSKSHEQELQSNKIQLSLAHNETEERMVEIAALRHEALAESHSTLKKVEGLSLEISKLAEDNHSILEMKHQSENRSFARITELESLGLQELQSNKIQLSLAHNETEERMVEIAALRHEALAESHSTLKKVEGLSLEISKLAEDNHNILEMKHQSEDRSLARITELESQGTLKEIKLTGILLELKETQHHYQVNCDLNINMKNEIQRQSFNITSLEKDLAQKSDSMFSMQMVVVNGRHELKKQISSLHEQISRLHNEHIKSSTESQAQIHSISQDLLSKETIHADLVSSNAGLKLDMIKCRDLLAKYEQQCAFLINECRVTNQEIDSIAQIVLQRKRKISEVDGAAVNEGQITKKVQVEPEI